ncbi:Hypothetical predicted protein, partial [Mytilus galloprovincialis]
VNSSKDEGRRTILDDWDAATKHKQTELTEADLNPQFVHVQTITKGQTFVPPYPTDEYMQDRLVTQMNWESYKDILINNIVEESKGHNHDRYSYKCPGIKL